MKNKNIYSSSVIFAVILLIDQISKFMISNTMRLYESITVIDNIFHITYVKNKGVAFGMMSNYPSVVFFVVLISVILLTYIILHFRGKNLWISWGVSMVLAGATGNFIDRLRLGYVVDFLDIHFWPGIFNVADSSIVIGTFVFLIGILKAEIMDERLHRREKSF